MALLLCCCSRYDLVVWRTESTKRRGRWAPPPCCLVEIRSNKGNLACCTLESHHGTNSPRVVRWSLHTVRTRRLVSGGAFPVALGPVLCVVVKPPRGQVEEERARRLQGRWSALFYLFSLAGNTACPCTVVLGRVLISAAEQLPQSADCIFIQRGASGDGARAGVPTSITYNFKYNIAWHKPVTSGRTPATTSSRFAQFRVCLSARRQCPRHEILYGGSKGLVEYGIGAVQLHSRRQAGR